MIKTVLFDLGNVILPFDLMRLAQKLTHFSPFSAKEILHNIGHNELLHEFEIGKITPKEYFDLATETCQFKNLSYDAFIAIFCDIFDENTDVVQLISQLKGNYQLGIISNTNPIHSSHLKVTYPSLSQFDNIWFSNEAGVRKP